MKEITEKVIKNIETAIKEQKNVTRITGASKQNYEIIRELALRKNKYQKLKELINIYHSTRFPNRAKIYYEIQ
jgi:hypothetical protein